MKNLTFFFIIVVMATSLQVNSQTIGCSAVQPPRITSFDSSKPRGLADNYYLWDNGATIYVKFLDGSFALQEQVKNIVKEWETYANIKFVFVATGSSNIRVNFDSKGGHNSLIGTLANMAKQSEKTVNFDTTDFNTYAATRRTVLHEFGHALGLLHEHYSPLAGIPWNKDAVYLDLKTTQGWDKETVDANLFQEYKISYTNGTTYDKNSIMHYPVLAKWTTNGYAVPWNNELSAGDKSLIETLYPKAGPRTTEVPRFVISNFDKMDIVNSALKQGLFIYPSFNLSTAGKEGLIYFTVFFYDVSGNPILVQNSKDYNINNVVATFQAFKLLPGKKVAANKTSQRNFEMYIPYSAFPFASGSTSVQAVFKVFLVDDTETKTLYASDVVRCSIIK